MSSQPFDYTVADFNYIEHADGPQRLRLFMPVGAGPFPLVVDVHGGAWCNGDLKDCEPRDLTLVRAGLAVAALNFRHAGQGYPSSLVDINYAIRWLKAHAGKLGLRADAVGLSGQSSGGHLAMLAAMRPADPRYAAVPSPDGAAVDASVKAVVMQWPVINPLSRYRNAVRLRDSGNPAGLGRRHPGPPRSLLEDHRGDGGRQPHADPGAGGNGGASASALDPGAAGPDARLS